MAYEILNNDKVINIIEANEEFCKNYCGENNYTYRIKVKEVDLEEFKKDKINYSKEQLALYLQNNPMLWTDGKYYSVTQEKQSQLTSNIATYEIESKTNPSAVITWNSTGEECEEWNINDLCVLAVAIRNYVKPMVSYQQAIEVQINNCSTEEEINNIEINYSSVDIQKV